MKHGKREMPCKRNKKALTALVAVALLLCCSVGGTLAWLATSTDPVENVFEVPVVSTEIEETLGNDGTKSDVKVQNGSEIDVYVRAAILVNWVKLGSDGEIESVYAAKPVQGVDYSCDINETNWKKIDGYYYHKGIVKAGEYSKVLIDEAEQLKDAPAKGYKLQVTILSEAIQADGKVGNQTAMEAAWGVKPSDLS